MKLKIGDRVWGNAGVKCEILGFAQHENAIHIKIRCPIGDRFITPDQINGYEVARLIKPGDRVKLKNTQLIYTVVSIYPVRCDGQGNTEMYCKLLTQGNTLAVWKLMQLELLDQ